MAEVYPISIDVLGGQFLAAALDALEESKLPKYMMEDRFSHKTGHVMYHKTNKSEQITLGRF